MNIQRAAGQDELLRTEHVWKGLQAWARKDRKWTGPDSTMNLQSYNHCTLGFSTTLKQRREQSAVQSKPSLVVKVVTGVEAGRLWHCFGHAPGRWAIGCKIERGANHGRSSASDGLGLDLVHVIRDLEDRGHGGLHAAGLVNAGLGLEIACRFQFKALVRATRDAWAAAERLFETSPKPVSKNKWEEV